jgi:hypothetical protein
MAISGFSDPKQTQKLWRKILLKTIFRVSAEDKGPVQPS